MKILQAKHDELLSELQGYGERVKEVNEKAYRMVRISVSIRKKSRFNALSKSLSLAVDSTCVC